MTHQKDRVTEFYLARTCDAVAVFWSYLIRLPSWDFHAETLKLQLARLMQENRG